MQMRFAQHQAGDGDRSLLEIHRLDGDRRLARGDHADYERVSLISGCVQRFKRHDPDVGFASRTWRQVDRLRADSKGQPVTGLCGVDTYLYETVACVLQLEPVIATHWSSRLEWMQRRVHVYEYTNVERPLPLIDYRDV
jgi:hypothetical protein